MKTVYGLIAALLLAGSAEAAEHYHRCESDADCVLVQDRICAQVDAVSKSALTQWEEADKLAAEHTCTPLPNAPKKEDYQAKCVNQLCEASRLTPW